MFPLFEPSLLNQGLQGIPVFVRPEHLSCDLLREPKLLGFDIVLGTIEAVIKKRDNALFPDVNYGKRQCLGTYGSDRREVIFLRKGELRDQSVSSYVCCCTSISWGSAFEVTIEVREKKFFVFVFKEHGMGFLRRRRHRGVVHILPARQRALKPLPQSCVTD